MGDLGKEVSDEMLARAFSKYPSFQKVRSRALIYIRAASHGHMAQAKTVRQAKTGEHKGYGFVSFGTIADMVKAIKEMDGKYIGNRPCKVRETASLARVTAALLTWKRVRS